MDIARSLVWDADLNEFSEHETEALGDSGLFDMMRMICSFLSLLLISTWPYKLLSAHNFFSYLFLGLSEDEGPYNSSVLPRRCQSSV